MKRIIRKAKRYLFLKKNINVGKNTRILTKITNFGSEPYLVEIGNNCTITSGVKFITHDASVGIALNYIGENRVVGKKKYEILGRITVHDNCMIGVNSIVLPGVKIGPNSIVGSGSVVTKDVKENSVYAGNPAKFICSLDEYVEKAQNRMELIEMNSNQQKRKEIILNYFSTKNDEG